MHSDVYKSIWFKLDMMMDIIELYILLQILLTLIQRSQECKKVKMFAPFISKFLIHLDGIWHTVEISLVAISDRFHGNR